ncbi:MAG: N-acetylmuramoyl-L-alanine amidase [Clostridia bacterium]|nr:N-acetylmuramoyl-L-alanine amidase [Clostridia bacterium]
MKRHRIAWILAALWTLWALPAWAAPAVTDAVFEQAETGIRYSFRAESWPYVCLSYKTADESGLVTLVGRDGAFEGTLLLHYLRAAKKADIRLLTPSQKELYRATVSLTPPDSREPARAEAGAVKKIRDITLTPGDRALGFSFTAAGHHALFLRVTSVMQRAEALVYEAEDGVFQGTLPLFAVNARDRVQVRICTLKGMELGQAWERTLFAAPDIGEQAAEGPLSGVKVCIDPGHQALPVGVGRVPLYPGSDETVLSGSNGMAQGVKTLRKESVAVLEISYRLCRRLREAGAEVVMTRWQEEVSLNNLERAEYANQEEADYFLRIHLNASSEGTNNAVYVYGPSHSPYALALMPHEEYTRRAQLLLDAIKASTGVAGGIVRMNDQFIGNNYAKMPAFLIEAGFLTTVANDVILTTADYQDKIARGITNGLIDIELHKGETEGI